MVNKHSAALAVGDVVITSFGHTSAVYPATTIAQQSLSPFSCVKLADGNAADTNGDGSHANGGFVGVVSELGSESGAVGSEVVVQFGGVCRAKVNPSTNNAVIGSKLALSDTAGELTNAGGATTDTWCAVALETKAAGSAGLINVVMKYDLFFVV
jgi:hypothetical protein